MKHFLQVIEEYFAHAARNAAQLGAQPGSTERKPNRAEAGEKADLLVCTSACETLQTHPIAPRGLEHSPLALSKTPISGNVRAESGALQDETSPSDRSLAQTSKAWPPTVGGFTPHYPPELARLIEAWPTLSQDTRDDILRIVRDNTPQPQDRREKP